MWKEMGKRILCLLGTAVCIGVCGLFMAAESRAEAVSAQAEGEPMDTSWMDKEVVLELDENNMDENGCTYELSAEGGTAEMKNIQISRYKDSETDIHIRVPDRVVKGGKEYVVTIICIEADNSNVKMKARFWFYAGKEVSGIGWRTHNLSRSVCCPHRESEYFVEENGVLFNRDKTKLIHFGDQYYGADKVYEIPETVLKISRSAFECAKIKEVVLNDKITALPWEAFYGSTLQKIDLKKVNLIEDYAFYDCNMLKEVRIRQEGVSIQQRAFSGAGIECLYLPPDACVDCYNDFSYCDNLKTVLIGGKLRIEEHSYMSGLFSGCSSLQTVILPEDMSDIMEDMFAECLSLRKLYVPESVKTIGERSFHVKGNLTLYAKEGSPAATYEDDNVSFVDVSNHTHEMKEVLFMKYDTWGVKGKYCEECGYGTEIKMIDFDEGVDKEIPVLETEEDTCPEVLGLDENCRDCQGVVYKLDEEAGTATVVDMIEDLERLLFLVPEKVEKNGKTYVVDTIGDSAMDSYVSKVILPDSVKKIEDWAMARVRDRIILGRGVEEIADNAFCYSRAVVDIRGENPCFKIESDGLYTADGSKLIKYTGELNEYCPDFKVPTRVRTIVTGAFYRNKTIHKITIHNCGEIEVQDGAFSECKAEITYKEGFWYEEGELILELDENNMDENGCTYRVSAEGSAYMDNFQISRYQDRETDIHIRIPDKVVKNGREYVVTSISISPDEYNVKMKAGFCIYAGKEVSHIGWRDMPCASVCYPHRESEYFAMEKGVLFNREKTELLHFSNVYYGENEVYEIPVTVSKIMSRAFEYAQIKEVVLNDKITALSWEAFYHSTLQRIDLKRVNLINDYAFSGCSRLKEVRIRQEGVSIWQRAFAWSGIESLYLPPDACVDCYDDFSGCDDLKTVIIGGKLQIEDLGHMSGLFSGCYSLQTAILPEDMSDIMQGMFDECMSLRKLYVPDNVEMIGERAFRVKGDLTLYARAGSPAAAYDDDNVSFVDMSGHTHTMREVMFIKYDTWGVKGKYCEECGYGTEIEMVDIDGGEDNGIPVLEIEEDTCPEVLELDEYDTDEQGVIYRLDAEGKTASIVALDNTRPFPKEFIMVPESVEKDGVCYSVEVVEEYGLRGADIIILPDSVKELERGSVDSSRRLVLGKGVENIHSGALNSSSMDIEIRGENPYYRMVDGVLYTSDNKTLLKRTVNDVNCLEKEYKIPSTVTRVMANAFSGNTALDQIDIYNCGEIEIEDSAFRGCYADICYGDGYTWYDPEDTVVDLDKKNKDENGFVYTLDGAYKEAYLEYIDFSQYDESLKELTVKIPDWVRKDGRTYKVTGARLESIGRKPDGIRIRLFIGKYVTDLIGLQYFGYLITAYDNLENDAYTSEQGSLFDGERKKLYRFCDESFDCGSMYKLPAETRQISPHAFYGTAIQKVDTNQVTVIDGYSFGRCDSLEEVIMRKEGMFLGSYAFMYTKKLKYIYVPCKSKLDYCCFEESSLKTIVLREGVERSSDNYHRQFACCKDLELCVLPESLTVLPEELFCDCSSLGKLYIPQGVEEVEENCFANVTGSIYAKEGGAVEESVKNSGTAQFVSLKNHTHHMERVTFFAFDTWAVTGDYCRECAYATQIKRVELEDEEDRAELPPLLTTVPPIPTPTEAPTVAPTVMPTEAPIVAPTQEVTGPPVMTPTLEATTLPVAPTESSTVSPTAMPTESSTVSPTVIPTVSSGTPTQEATGTPVVTFSTSPGTPTQEVTVAPTVTPTITLTEAPTVTSTVSPGTPTQEVTVPPTVTSTVLPAVSTKEPAKSEEPMETATVPPEIPTGIPTAVPSENPAVTPTAVSSTVSKPEPTHGPETQLKESAAPASTAPGVIRNSDPSMPMVTGFKIFTKNNKSARLQWKGNGSVTSYRIYRSRKKKGKYQVVKTVAKNRKYYVDKKIKPTVKYYYKVKALGYFGGKEVEGNVSPVRSICVSGICNPKISVKKGRMKQLSYVSVYLRKYQGKYADIHISINKKKFKKLKLVSNKIARYKGKFKIQYMIKNKEIRFKVRTYRKKGKKKLYSNFSNVVRVRV